MAYGQHQSFHLRDRWLSKALKGVFEDERFFYDNTVFEQVGLGKNMVQSLRFWVEATKVVDRNEGKRHFHTLSKLGKLVLHFDKVIQMNDTSSILHYHIVTDENIASTWYWYFNIYNEKETTKEDMFNSLSEWVQERENKKIADSSLKKDIDCLIRLYTSGQDIGDPEEVKHSPLSKVNLLIDVDGYIYKRTPEISEVGLTALMYVLLDYCNVRSLHTITVSEIEHNSNLWGKVFNFNRRLIVSALDRLSKHQKYPLRFIRTNRLDDVQVPSISAMEFLKYEYIRMEEELNVLI